MSLGSNIKEQRKHCGISQEKLAEMVGVSRQAVTKWETGQSAPSTENLIRLAEIFSIPLDALVSLEKAEAVPRPTETQPPIPAAPPVRTVYIPVQPPKTEEQPRKWTIWRKISVCLLLLGLLILMPMGLLIARGSMSDQELTVFHVLAKILSVCFYGGFGCKFIDAMIHISKGEH